jgi:hypothetical protein
LCIEGDKLHGVLGQLGQADAADLVQQGICQLLRLTQGLNDLAQIAQLEFVSAVTLSALTLSGTSALLTIGLHPTGNPLPNKRKRAACST